MCYTYAADHYSSGNHQADCISSWTKHVECASGNQRIHETSGTGWRCRFLFLPAYVAYSGAKRFGANIPMALFIAGILLPPSLIDIVNAGEAFHVYGIPDDTDDIFLKFHFHASYYMGNVLRGKRSEQNHSDSLRALLFPVLLIFIMLPISLCVLGPLGAIIGKGIADAIVALHTVFGPITIGIVGALWPLLIVTGMHQALIAIALSYIASVGFDNSILVGAIVSNYAMMAICLAFLLKAKMQRIVHMQVVRWLLW